MSVDDRGCGMDVDDRGVSVDTDTGAAWSVASASTRRGVPHVDVGVAMSVDAALRGRCSQGSRREKFQEDVGCKISRGESYKRMSSVRFPEWGYAHGTQNQRRDERTASAGGERRPQRHPAGSDGDHVDTAGSGGPPMGVSDLFEYRPEWDAPVVGAVPTVEIHRTHRAFVEAVDPDAMLVPFVRARHCVKRGESVADWLPESVDRSSVTVITTMTVSDDHLARISWEREVDVIEAFRPDYHVPADYPVYGDDDPDQRLENCMRCAVGTEWVDQQLPDDVGVIPLIKGTTPDERAVCERQAAHMGAEMVAVYGGQYFGAAGGGGRSRLVEDLQAIDQETGRMPTLVIGSLSPWVLKETPPNVVAGAGLRAWREAVKPRSASSQEMQRRYADLAADVIEALELTPPPEGYDAPAGVWQSDYGGDGDGDRVDHDTTAGSDDVDRDGSWEGPSRGVI